MTFGIKWIHDFAVIVKYKSLNMCPKLLKLFLLSFGAA